MTHIMVDLETLGLTPGSVIRSIGAVAFDPLSGKLGAEFYANIQEASCLEAGLTVDPATLTWWERETSPEARARLRIDQRPLPYVLDWFTKFWRQQDGEQLWAHGPNFDEVLLAAAYRAVGEAVPWDYRAPRCTRTIYNLAGVAPNRDVGVQHDALVDAKNQAIAVHDAYVKLGLAQRPETEA